MTSSFSVFVPNYCSSKPMSHFFGELTIELEQLFLIVMREIDLGWPFDLEWPFDLKWPFDLRWPFDPKWPFDLKLTSKWPHFTVFNCTLENLEIGVCRHSTTNFRVLNGCVGTTPQVTGFGNLNLPIKVSHDPLRVMWPKYRDHPRNFLKIAWVFWVRIGSII